MTGRLMALVAVLIAFGVLTTLALMDVGYFGIIAPHFKSWGGGQVFTDLVIVCLLACVWMRQDAKQKGIAAWPYILLTLVAGSFGPLLYLVTRELRQTVR